MHLILNIFPDGSMHLGPTIVKIKVGQVECEHFVYSKYLHFGKYLKGMITSGHKHNQYIFKNRQDFFFFLQGKSILVITLLRNVSVSPKEDVPYRLNTSIFCTQISIISY